MGVFASYLKDNHRKILQDCFDFDWENMKKLKFKKSQESEVREEMNRVY